MGGGVTDVVETSVGEEALVGCVDDVLRLRPASGAVEEAVLIALKVMAAAAHYRDRGDRGR